MCESALAQRGTDHIGQLVRELYQVPSSYLRQQSFDFVLVQR